MENFLPTDQELVLEKNLVWLFGSPRGGTSWVSLELLSHDTLSLNEMHISDHLETKVPKGARQIDFRKNKKDYFFCAEFKYTWKIFLRKLILNRIHAQLNDLSHKIIIKEPMAGPGAADLIAECMPNSKIIILLRDGRDVMDSIWDATTKDGFMLSGGASNASGAGKTQFINNHSKRWMRLIDVLTEIQQKHSPNLCTVVKYEDILKDTAGELEKLYKFLEINISKDEIKNIIQKYDFNKIPEDKRGSGKFHRSAKPGKWRENFNDEEQNLMNSLLGETLVKLGYQV